MKTLPFSEFDEANRAEGARNMAKFSYWFAPITGSPFFRRDDLSIDFNDRSQVNIHLERNPLVFVEMALFSKFFGDKELLYRLPSFLFGLITIVTLFLYFLKTNALIAVLALLPMIFSYDWWMSSQMAHLDTGLTLFLTLTILTLQELSRKENSRWWLVSIFVWLAFLIKGQMVIFLIAPLIVSIVLGKADIKKVFCMGALSTALIVLSLLPIWFSVGVDKWFEVYVLGVLSNRAVQTDMSQVAPVWWYGYWWLFSFRLGVFLFIPLLINDFLNRRIDKDKWIVLSYIIVNFGLMSVMKNKVWWYVMPLMPAISMYIFMALKDLSVDKKLSKILLILIVSMVPLFWGIEIGLKRVVVYSLVVMCINCLIIFGNVKTIKLKSFYFIPVVLFGLFYFLKRFPRPSASYPEVKRLLDGVDITDGCVYVSGMTYEGVMYYSKSGEINFWGEKEIDSECHNYLISPNVFEFEKIKEVDRLKLYKVNI